MRRIAYGSVLGICLSVVLVLAGCALMHGKPKPPSVRLVGLSLTDASIFEQQYVASLRVFNPNDVDLSVDSIDYRIAVAGHDFADGVTTDSFTLPANGQTVVGLRVHTTLLGVLRQVLKWDHGVPETLPYNISGTVHLNSWFVPSIPFDHDGKVPLKDALHDLSE